MASSKYPSRGILAAINAFRHDRRVLNSSKLWKAKDGKLRSIELWVVGERYIYLTFLPLKTYPYNVTIIDDFLSNHLYTNVVASID